jgi:transposase-like protein
MTKPSPFKWFKTSPEIIRLAVMLYVRFPLSLRNVEDLLHERGVDVSHETVRFWWHRFGPMFASEIRKRRIEGMKSSRWRWHLDEMFVKINGERHYLWRAVDHEGEVLESFVTKTRDKKAASEIPQESNEEAWSSESFVTDKLRSYGAAMKDLGVAASAGNRPLAEQPGGEFTPAVPTTGAGDAPLPAHAKSAEVRRRPRLRHEPFQPGTQPLQQTPLQGQPRRRSRRVARSLRGIRGSVTVLAETGSN